jgi:hypothetical protein
MYYVGYSKIGSDRWSVGGGGGHSYHTGMLAYDNLIFSYGVTSDTVSTREYWHNRGSGGGGGGGFGGGGGGSPGMNFGKYNIQSSGGGGGSSCYKIKNYPNSITNVTLTMITANVGATPYYLDYTVLAGNGTLTLG